VATLRFPAKGRPDVAVRLERLDRTVPQQARTQALVRKWMDTGYDAFRRQGMQPDAIVTTTTAAFDGREQTVRNRPGGLTSLIVEALQREAHSDVAILNGGTVRIDDMLPAGPIRQYDIIRVLPFGGKVLKVTMDGALLQQTLEAGEANAGSGGFLHPIGASRRGDSWIVNGKPLDPAAAYSVAMPEFLMTGQEARMPFLTRDRVRAVEDRKDIRLVLIDELLRRFGPAKELVDYLRAFSL
jgi:5'-nucleotidase/UDP-sugar diphosphatase